jgi:hypothetical protein
VRCGMGRHLGMAWQYQQQCLQHCCHAYCMSLVVVAQGNVNCGNSSRLASIVEHPALFCQQVRALCLLLYNACNSHSHSLPLYACMAVPIAGIARRCSPVWL